MADARWRRIIALALAVVAGLILILTEVRPDPVAEPDTLTQVWPQAPVAQTPGVLADGATYQPALFLDLETSIGTAQAPVSDQVRLVLLTGQDATELRRIPVTQRPQFDGFTTDGEVVAWAETTATGPVELWTVRPGRGPQRLTAQTGSPVFFNSQYDLVIADGHLHWTAAGDGLTEVRSVPLAGGRTTVRQVPGDWALSTWPWLVSTATGAPQLRHLQSGQTLSVPVAPGELVTCSPRWCRVLIAADSAAEPAIDLMRLDGSERQRVAEGVSAVAALVDVAVADRFEVYSVVAAAGGPVSNQRLMLYDVRQRRTVTVATAVGRVLARGDLLWWSIGDNETLRWHVLDLATLPAP